MTVARDGLLSRSYEKPVPVALVMTDIKQRFAGGPMLLIVGLVVSGPIRGNQSDQLPQGVAGLSDAPRGALSFVVDAAGGDPRDPERPGLAAGHGAFCQAVTARH